MHLRIILVFEVERYTDVTYLGSGVTVRYDFGTIKKKTTMLGFFSFILNTIVQITFFFFTKMWKYYTLVL